MADAYSPASYKDPMEWRPDADDLAIPSECHDEVRAAWHSAGLSEDGLDTLLEGDGPRAPTPRG